MPDTQEYTDRKLEQMSEEELRQILREDASNLEKEDTDMEWILRAMEVLATRRKEQGEGTSPAEAMVSFNENYCTSESDYLISEKSKGTVGQRPAGLWKRLAAVAAVLVLAVSLGAVTASAWNFNLWDVICRWTKETFFFGTFGEETVRNGQAPCASLQAALDENMITQKLVPTWLPDGYVEDFIDIQESPKQRSVCARYLRGDQEIIIRITDYLGNDPNQVEQSGNLLEIYTSGNHQYYIFENNQLIHTVWINNNFEGSIFGSLTLDEIKRVIDSIEKG